MDAVTTTRNRNDVEIRKTREEYQKREADLVKRHKRELRRISQDHADTIRKMNDNQALQLDDLREKSRKALSKKDEHYQLEMSKIRKAGQIQLENKVDEVDQRLKRQVADQQKENTKIRQINEVQKERMKARFLDEMKNRERIYSESVRANNINSQKALDKRITNLREKQKEELTLLRQDRDNKITEKAKEFDRYRVYSQRERKELKRVLGNRLEMERRTHAANTVGEREAHANALKMNQRTFEEDLRVLREKYDVAYKKNEEENLKARQLFEDSVNRRDEAEIGRLEGNIIALKRTHDGEKMMLRHKFDLARKNLQKSYALQLKGFEDNREQLISEFNSKRGGELKELAHKKDLHFKRQMRNVRRDQTTRDTLNRQALEDQTIFIKEREQHFQNQAERRIRNMKIEMTKRVNELDDNYTARLAAAKDDFVKTLNEIRIHNTEERNKIVRRFQTRGNDREKYYNQKIKDIKINNNAEMERVKRDHGRQLKQLAESKDMLLKNTIKAHDKEVKSVKMRLDQQVDSMKETHNEEVTRLRKSHSEELRKLIISQGGQSKA